MFYRFLLLSILTLFSSQAFAEGKLYDINKDETKAKFVTKMCSADILQGVFENLSGQIFFDKENPENSWVEVTIDARSLSLDKEFHGDHNLKTVIESDQILKTEEFPTITLKSTKIEKTSEFTGLMTADMTLVGETHPVTLEITFENTMTDRYAIRPKDRNKIAFSAYGTFKRTDWNLLYGLDRIGIRRMANDVQILISTAASLHQSP